jgi:hypothetical protein
MKSIDWTPIADPPPPPPPLLEELPLQAPIVAIAPASPNMMSGEAARRRFMVTPSGELLEHEAGQSVRPRTS